MLGTVPALSIFLWSTAIWVCASSFLFEVCFTQWRRIQIIESSVGPISRFVAPFAHTSLMLGAKVVLLGDVGTVSASARVSLAVEAVVLNVWW